jgi:hypothetical protein
LPVGRGRGRAKVEGRGKRGEVDAGCEMIQVGMQYM